MTKLLSGYKKIIAVFFFITFFCELITPTSAFALTSGPVQPEMKSFEPAGTTDMVDLFTGDFSYNIPLLDVGGYPVNLSYHSGAGMDDEASWVGHGWTLNPGAVNRQMRGLPDDFNGSDEVVVEKNMKSHITKVISERIKVDLLGIPGKKKLTGKSKKSAKAIKFSPSISIGVKYDNYRGIGTQLGLNAGLSVGEAAAGSNTKDLDATNPNDPADSVSFTPKKGVNFGLDLSSLDGATTNINFSIIKNAVDKSNDYLSKSVGFPYNSRAGLQGMTLSSSFKITTADVIQERKLRIGSSNSSFVSFVGNTYTPTVDFPTKNTSFTLDVSGGAQLQLFYLGGGITGFYTKQELAYKKINKPSYGFMYSEKGKNNEDALLDFNREKDVPYNKSVNYLPIPVPTNDLFSVSSQTGGGQYRIYRGSSGTFFDPKTKGVSNDLSVGIELGFGNYFDVGADLH